MIDQKKIPLLVIWLSFLVSAISILSTSFCFNLFQYGDNCGYISLGIAFAEGRGFIDPSLPYPIQSLWWPPGFPLVIAMFYKIFGAQWVILKIILFLMLLSGITFFCQMLLKRGEDSVKIILLCFSMHFCASVHLLSSYLYTETFFLTLLLFFFAFPQLWEHNRKFIGLLVISIFMMFILSVRLVGIALPIAYTIWLLWKKWPLGAVVPFLSLVLIITIFIKVESLRVGSLESINTKISIGGINPIDTIDNSANLQSRYIKSLRGYSLTLIPQAVIRRTYDSFKMNKTKSLLMAMISFLCLLGFLFLEKSFRLLQIFTIITFLILFRYGPLYLRLLVPLAPFLLLFLFNGIEKFSLIFSQKKIARIIVICLWLLIIADNMWLTLTNPQRTMPYSFSSDGYQECIEWICQNSSENSITISQVNHYLYLMRGGINLPFLSVETTNKFIEYCKQNNVKFILVSPDYQRPSYTFMSVVKEAEMQNNNYFERIFQSSDPDSYILKFYNIN